MRRLRLHQPELALILIELFQNLVWDKQNSYTSPPMVSTTIVTGSRGSSIGTGFGVGFGGQTTNYRCQTYFEVDKAKTVLSWKTQGNDCRK